MDNVPPSRILIVDDATENIDILTAALTGYRKMIALNGERALRLAFSDNPPDLILLDINMPGMDGYEVCKTLKTNEKTREIPVIFLTANTDSESIIRGFEVGANDYITKPFNMGEMLARVKTHLALKKSKDDIARLLLDIEGKNRLITSSIEYAQTIQQALLPDDDRLDQLLPEHFILYHPKDIVSGDFYWVRQADGSVLVAAVDCTGHGVPGAFMSILGLSFLNEVTRSKYCCPANILDQVRKKVKHALKQTGEFAEQRDGMDMALVQLGNDHRSLKYAGAYNPLYLVREGVLTEYKGDRQPVAIHYREKPFTNHTVDLLPGDSFYIFSDGFADQIGGEHDRKLMSGTFKEWLREIAGEPMQKQKMILEERIRTWQGDNEQTDDILVIGMKV
jgi:CheY-like chemotaxis protein